MARYEERLTAYQSVDFDDLIGLPLRCCKTRAGARSGSALAHVLVDEYQDTNATQYELLKLLVGRAGPSPPWATTTRASTAGAAPRWTTCGACRRTTRSSRSSSWSRTTAPPAPSCARPTT
jgi:superfamily I DNA/RNA helicase